MNRLLLTSILIAASWAASAADSELYKVEFIVFENLDPAMLQAEQWPDDPGTPSLDNAMALDALPVAAIPAALPEPGPVPTEPVITPLPATPEAGITGSGAVAAPPPDEQSIPAWRWLNPQELSLNDAINRLAASKRYRPLLHVGWVQPLEGNDLGTPVHIYEGLKPREGPAAVPMGEAPAAGAQNAVTAQAAEPPLPFEVPVTVIEDNPAPVVESLTKGPQHVFDGTFTLRRGRYLHADVDLGYWRTAIPPGTPPDVSAAEPVTRYVRMVQSRRMRSDEVHYLDHPLFGMLFVVSPYQATPAEPTAK